MLSNEQTFSKTIESMREEAKLPTVTNSGKNLLEKKWTSVVRLQKRVMELEAKIASNSTIFEQLKANQGGDGNNATVDLQKALPKGPPKTSLSGHRDPVTCIAVHPCYSICASGSEDTTIRIYVSHTVC